MAGFWVDTGGMPSWFYGYDDAALAASARGDAADSQYWASVGFKVFPPLYSARAAYKRHILSERAKCKFCAPGAAAMPLAHLEAA